MSRNFPVGGLPDPLVIRLEQTGIPAGYIFADVTGLQTGARRDDKVIQIDSVSSGSAVNAGVFVDKRSIPFEFSGTIMDQGTNLPLKSAKAQLTYTTTTGLPEVFPFSSDSSGNWSVFSKFSIYGQIRSGVQCALFVEMKVIPFRRDKESYARW